MNLFGGKSNRVIEIRTDQIDVNPYQPRKHFDPVRLKELARSIDEIGLLQPIIVRKHHDKPSMYELVAGERRLRAAKLANLDVIPALIREFDEYEIAQAAIIENVQREDLNPIEEAIAYDKVLYKFGMTQTELAERVGKSQSTIANKLRILKLPTEIKELISEGHLTERHGRALLSIDNRADVLKIAQDIIDFDLNVKQTIDRIEALKTNKVKKKRRRIGFIRDVRIFINSINDAYSAMKEAGVDAEMIENDTEDYHEFIIRVPK
jgi:ParB family chromosome partitioning protein